MGLFMWMAGVVGGREDSVVDALRGYAMENDMLLDVVGAASADEATLTISTGAGGVTILFPDELPTGSSDWEGVSQYLSEKLRSPVFWFHIHDGDLWMYLLFDNGEVVDQFNPVPEYWEELESDELASWQGNAKGVALRVPGLVPEQIARYLVQWGDDVVDSPERKKAYPTDAFFYGDDWQVVDFMKTLGLDYPVDDHGAPKGATYRFVCNTDGSN